MNFSHRVENYSLCSFENEMFKVLGEKGHRVMNISNFDCILLTFVIFFQRVVVEDG